jgi:branched-chain amino acid aminotransferase
MNPSAKIWYNGELIDWDKAQIHVLSHVIHYGSACFEGIRCYKTNAGSMVFRLGAHIRRLIDSATIYRLDLDYDEATLTEAVLQTIRANGLEACYVRPIVLRGYGHLGVNPEGIPIETYIAVWEWGAYLGTEALESGVNVCVSSWSRSAPNTFPATAKAAGHYLNSQLIKLEAAANGYAEGIALDTDGYISEGSGENIFLVRDGVLYTPGIAHSVLGGITRDSVITICRDSGIEVREQAIPREWLYIADELFFTGTAAEITPIRSVDKIAVGPGRRGPVTEQIQSRFFGIVNGQSAAPEGWLTPVN